MDSAQTLPPIRRLGDYRPPDWLVPDAELRFELDPERTLVHARLQVVRNGDGTAPLILDGEQLELLALAIDGVAQPLPNDSASGLHLHIAADHAVIETTVAINPAANSRLMGLYASDGLLCTQCEAEGFRRISYFPDRPDVLTRFRVRLEADRAAYPQLLSNGNPGASGDLGGGRHFAEWNDPFPKPCYLFAVVAGNLDTLEDRFVTRSGRVVRLRIFVARRDLPRTAHAMDSLKRAMAFDEDRYGREYDLDVFNMVAVRDFNFGAMENKGLNIFNARYILADHETATDSDFDAISAIIAHEYFHNWSGNRVTCRDWFQLALKEGFTVFRDQQFSAAIGSAAVKRIEVVRDLRATQFAEDAGPLAHPVQPDTYMEINNFYTTTIYDKGAELIRMMQTMLGEERFRHATDRYFTDNDGRAATIDDFLEAMASQGLDIVRFRRWYHQAGTPVVRARFERRPEGGFDILFAQQNPKAPPGAPPLPIPLPFAAFDRFGRLLAANDSFVLTETRARITLPDVQEPPILSLNRGFAAPIVTHPPPPRAALKLLARHETDPFARYEAVQQLMLSVLIESVTAAPSDDGAEDVAEVMTTLLNDWQHDPAFHAETIFLPTEAVIGDHLDRVNPEAIHAAREGLRQSLAARLGERLHAIWAATVTEGCDLSARAKGLRRMRAASIRLLTAPDTRTTAGLALHQYQTATSMTDRMSALAVLTHSRHDARIAALADYFNRNEALPGVIDKWFAVQAHSTRSDTLAVVRALLEHRLYDRRNPNRVRALLLAFAGNHSRFHDREGAGYALLADNVIATDAKNPQLAARLCQPLTRWRRFADPWGSHMHAALETVASQPGLSRDLTEVTIQGLK